MEYGDECRSWEAFLFNGASEVVNMYLFISSISYPKRAARLEKGATDVSTVSEAEQESVFSSYPTPEEPSAIYLAFLGGEGGEKETVSTFLML